MYTETVVKFTVKISFNDLMCASFFKFCGYGSVQILIIFSNPDPNYNSEPDPDSAFNLYRICSYG